MILGQWNVGSWGMLEVVATIEFRTFSLAEFLSRATSYLKKVSLIILRRVWGRTAYLSSMLRLVTHSTKTKQTKQMGAKLIQQLINETLRVVPKVTQDQMINALISPRNLFNKRSQFNRKYAVLPESLNRPPESSNLENTNNARKWDVARAKNGRLKLGLSFLRYPTAKTTTSHASRKPKHSTRYHIPTDTPCLPTRTGG